MEYAVRPTQFDEFMVEAVYARGDRRDIALIAVFATQEAADALARDLNKLKYLPS